MDALARIDAIAALQLLAAFGADEALDEAPLDRRRVSAAMPPPPRHVEGQPPATLPPPARPASAHAARAASPPPARAASPQAVRAANPQEAARAEAAAATSLTDLLGRLARFTICPLAATATKAAIADGNPASGLVLVGDVPGEAEDRSGRPFDGEAGALLDRMLGAIKLDRQRAYLVNLIPWRPPGGRAPNPIEIALCEPFLRRHLALSQPRVIVAFGTLPARVLTGETGGMRKLRGSWHEVTLDDMPAPVPLLVTHHPLALLATPAAKRDAWIDLQSLRDKIATLS